MQPIRRIVEDAPDSAHIPEEVRDRRRERSTRPLDKEPRAAQPARPRFNIAQVDHIDVPSREERNSRLRHSHSVPHNPDTP